MGLAVGHPVLSTVAWLIDRIRLAILALRISMPVVCCNAVAASLSLAIGSCLL